MGKRTQNQRPVKQCLYLVRQYFSFLAILQGYHYGPKIPWFSNSMKVFIYFRDFSPVSTFVYNSLCMERRDQWDPSGIKKFSEEPFVNIFCRNNIFNLWEVFLENYQNCLTFLKFSIKFQVFSKFQKIVQNFFHKIVLA